MKKYLLAIVAFALALTFSAFKNVKPKTKLTDLYWFKISGQHLPGASVPSSDATFIRQSADAPIDSECPGDTYDCIAGFDQSKVNTSNNTLNGPQVPNSVDATKAN